MADWDLGATEGGSSGSPLFDQHHRIVGQLHGGQAACGNDDPDWYGRLFTSWTGDGTAGGRLSDWLDPLNSGLVTLDGRDIIESPFTLDVSPATLEVCAPDDAVYDVVVGTDDEYAQAVTLSVSGEPAGTLAVFDVNPVTPVSSTVLTIGNTGAAAAGSYQVDVIGVSPTSTLTTTVGLNLYTDAPSQPTLLAPADGATDRPLAPTLEWESAPWAGSYNLQLDTNPHFGAPWLAAGGILETNYTLEQPLDGGRCYWWRLQAENSCGPSNWTTPFLFATVALQASFYDDVESGAGNWSHQADAGSDHWSTSTVDAHSPTHAWFVPDSNTITDSYLWNTSALPLGVGSTLTFWHRHQFEGNYDGAVLEISTDGGGAWDDLGPYLTANGYNGTLNTGYNNPLGGRDAWVGDLAVWTQVQVDLSSFAGQEAHFRWRIGCDSSVSDVGWYIDDVQLASPLPPNPAPALASITPDVSSAFEQTPVQIEGSHFLETPSLRLGETWLLSVTQASTTTLNAVVPAGLQAGIYDLTLYNGDCQEAVLPDAYTAITECVSPVVTLESNSPVLLGQAVHFSATLAAGTLPLTYAWDLGDGETAAGQVVSHVYAEVGVYRAAVTAENLCGSYSAGGEALVTIPLDIDRDCDVDILDVMLAAAHWGCAAGEPCYDPLFDMDGDGDVDVVDLMQIAAQWGFTC